MGIASVRASDKRNLNRRRGFAKRGQRARSGTTFFLRGACVCCLHIGFAPYSPLNAGQRYSLMGPFDVQHGFLDFCIVKGGFTNGMWLEALKRKVIPHMNPFPGDRSVLLL